MKRIVLAVATISAASVLAAAPAFAGLVGNSSFSHQIPVPVPSGAHRVQQVEDHLSVVSTTPPAPKPSRSHLEPGDDHGGATRHSEPGDDRSSSTSRAPEPGDDHGGASSGTSGSGTSGSGTSGSDSSGSGTSGRGGNDDPSGHH
jgi:hypothetical protein